MKERLRSGRGEKGLGFYGISSYYYTVQLY